MKILVTDLIIQLLEQREMNVFDLHAEMNRIRKTRIDSLRSRLDFLHRQGRIIRKSNQNSPVYQLNKMPSVLGGSPRLRETDSLLAGVRTVDSLREVRG